MRTAGRLNRREAKADNTVNTGKKATHFLCTKKKKNGNKADSSRYTK